MVTRKSRYGWMSLGGLLCLFALAVVCKVRDGNRAEARTAPIPVPAETAGPEKKIPAPDPLPPLVQVAAAAPKPADPAPPLVAPAPEVKPAVMPNTPTPPVPGSDSRPILIPAGATDPVPPSSGPPGVIPFPPESGPGKPTTRDNLLPPPSPPPPSTKPAAPPKTELPPPSPTTPPPNNATPPAPPTTADPLVVTPLPPTLPPKVEVNREHPGEPPLAPTPGPVIPYKVKVANETFKTLARKMLGSAERWGDIHKLNPTLHADARIAAGTVVRLPGDACVQEDADHVRALPSLRTRALVKTRTVLPLTGTYSVTLDDDKGLTLPRAIQQQLGNCDTVLVSPGSDRCLWLTNQAHLDRLQAKLDRSPARESDIRGFKRLYYAQTVKCSVKEGRVLITDKLAQFASLGAEVVLVGIDDHFEVWDAARWKRYTQTKKALTTEE